MFPIESSMSGDYSELCKEFNISPERLATLKEVYDKRKAIPTAEWEKELRELIKEVDSNERAEKDTETILDEFEELPEHMSFENFVRVVYFDEDKSTTEQKVDLLFCLFDTDNSGFLEPRELKNLFDDEEERNMMMTLFDSNGDGKLSKEEFIDMIKISDLADDEENMSDAESMRLFFKLVDRDQNGYLDEGELDIFWKLFKLGEPDEDGDAITPKMIIALADTDGDGRLSFEEFMAFFSMKSDKVSNEATARLFMSMFDTNGDGFLDRSEIQPFLEAIELPISAKEFLDMFDSNGDGKLSMEELVAMFQKFDELAG